MSELEDLVAQTNVRLDERSLSLRQLVVRGLIGGNRGHLGSAASLIEILRVLYDDVMRFDSGDPSWPQRDRFILSKGHGCLAQYALLADKGFFAPEELDRFCASDSFLGGHPEAGEVPGVEASTGALGHGLPIGLGMALAARIKRESHRVFVVMGDGECDEGSVWEAAMCAGKHQVSNLVAIIDYNKIQSFGATSEVQDLEPLVDKWQAFNFSVREVDGHDVRALTATLSDIPFDSAKPSALICHTVKGKGFPFAEHNPLWHHKSKLTETEIRDMNRALNP